VSNKELYKDEFGVYREVIEEEETSIDGFEDDEDLSGEDEDSDNPFDSLDDDEDVDNDEDEEYANSRKVTYEDEDED
jgi:hypothetical protein